MKHLNDNELLKETNRLRKIEQKTIAELLKYFAEINRRRLFADLGCSSLYEYLTKKMGYSEGLAARRISAMRLVQSNPLAKKKWKAVNSTLLMPRKSPVTSLGRI